MPKKSGKHGKSPSKGSGKNHNIVSMFKQQSIKQQMQNSDITGGETTMKKDQSSIHDKGENKLHHTALATDVTENSLSSLHKNKFSSLSRKRKLETSNSDNPHLKRQPTEEPSTSTDSLNLSQKENSNIPTSSHTEEPETSNTAQVKGKQRLSLKHQRNKNCGELSAMTASKTEINDAETLTSTVMKRKRTKGSTDDEDRMNTEVGTETQASGKAKGGNKTGDRTKGTVETGDRTKGRDETGDRIKEKVESVKSTASSQIKKPDGGNKAHSRDRTNDEDNEQEEFDNDSADNVIIHEDGTIEYRVPYYLENFLLVLNSVTKDEFFCDLFNEDDHTAIQSYLELSDNSQKLYVRLFGRKYRWLARNKISYPKISEDLKEELDELVEAKLLLNEEHLDDLSVTLHALPAPEVRTLAKTLHLPPNQTRQQLIEAILKHAQKSSIGSFFSGGKGSGTSGVVLKRAKAMLGSAFCLSKEAQLVFLRTMMLFGLHRTRGEDDDSYGNQQLFQMLMSNIGQVKYPDYAVNRSTHIFQDRQAFLLFSEALQFEQAIGEALENKDFDAAEKVYERAKEKVKEINETHHRHAKTLPHFLRQYTAGAIYTRVLSYGVELLQYQKQYTSAVQQLEELIEQDVYHTDYRGRWYDRLALNLDYHLKQTNKALDKVQTALNDPCVRAGHRLSLLQRADKICHTTSHNKFIRGRWEEFKEDSMAAVQEAPKVIIKAVQLATSDPGMHASYVWLLPDDEDHSNEGGGGDNRVIMKRVEDVALKHYRDQGYVQGLHGEGGTFTCLVSLLFWDVIFLAAGVPDVFYHQYQTQPLDLGTDCFYETRAEMIEARLREIEAWSNDELCEKMSSTWETHFGTLCGAISWERFDSLEHMQGLVRCFGSRVLAGICCRLIKNWRFCRGGVPDLVVWNPDTAKVKVVEVKGPGDRLSTKQILWLDYLLNLGVDAEVCHVQGISSKKLLL